MVTNATTRCIDGFILSLLIVFRRFLLMPTILRTPMPYIRRQVQKATAASKYLSQYTQKEDWNRNRLLSAAPHKHLTILSRQNGRAAGLYRSSTGLTPAAMPKERRFPRKTMRADTAQHSRRTSSLRIKQTCLHQAETTLRVRGAMQEKRLPSQGSYNGDLSFFV